MSATTPEEESSEDVRGPRARDLRDRVRFIAELFSDTADRFSENEGYRLVAAFSYYATFSIFPLLLLSLTVIGFIVGDSTLARERLLSAIAAPNTPVRGVLEHTLIAMQESQSARGLSTVVAIGTLLFSASGAFVELDDGLNRIWCVPRRKAEGVLGSIRLFVVERLSGFAIVVAIGLTLAASLVSGAILTFIAARAESHVSTPLWPALMHAANVAVGIALLSFVFTLAFHFIPRSHPPMRMVVGGAILTTAFLTEVREIFALYLAHFTRITAYGVAGSVLALAAWIYVSSLIIYFGAQLTRVRAEKLGVTKQPCDDPR